LPPRTTARPSGRQAKPEAAGLPQLADVDVARTKATHSGPPTTALTPKRRSPASTAITANDGEHLVIPANRRADLKAEPGVDAREQLVAAARPGVGSGQSRRWARARAITRLIVA
jgi:hypothetical protein